LTLNPAKADLNASTSIVFHGFKGTSTIPILTGRNKQPTFKEIPTVDCKGIFSEAQTDRISVAHSIRQAFLEVVILYATNHGVPIELEANVYRVSKEFFRLEHDEKIRVHNEKSKHKRGYQYLLEGRSDEPDRGGKASLLLLAMLTHVDFRECFKMVAVPQIEDSDLDKASSLLVPQIYGRRIPRTFRNICANTTTRCETFQYVLSASFR
jgi:hypothetical protein